VRALCLSRLLVIERSKFNDLVRKEPVLGVKLLWSLAQVLSYRLDETSDLLVGARGEHGDHNDLDTLAPF
jgi:hypothetical protein